LSDPSKSFGEAAQGYATFRPQYPQAIFNFLLDNLKGARDVAVDLGAGSGQATQALAKMFNRVIAIEPDARQAEGGSFPPNAAVKICASEEADFEPQAVDAVISATAFHWMDQPVVCSNVYRWLRPGGVFFPFAYDEFTVEGPAKKIVAREFEKWRPFRDRRLLENYDYEKALRASGAFDEVIPFSHAIEFALSADAAAGLVSTFSFTRAYAATQKDPAAYFASLKDELAASCEQIAIVAPFVGAVGRKI